MGSTSSSSSTNSKKKIQSKPIFTFPLDSLATRRQSARGDALAFSRCGLRLAPGRRILAPTAVSLVYFVVGGALHAAPRRAGRDRPFAFDCAIDAFSASNAAIS